jgi:outer membrane immunogenic protein
MRRVIVASTLGSILGSALLAASSAQAADLALKAPPPPACDWCGAYIGVNIGGDWGRAAVSPQLGTIFPAFNNAAFTIFTPAQLGTYPATSGRGSSVIGGGQAGYNWQTGHYVLGVEGDIDGTGLRANSSSTVTRTTLSGTQTVTANFSARIDWIATVRVRAGYAWDRAMLYATGGIAAAGTSLNTTYAEVQPSPVPTPGSASASQAVAGWTAGVGGEWLISRAWSAGLEYRHTGFSIHGYNIGLVDNALIPFLPPSNANVRFSTDQVTLRLNYHLH